MTSIRCIFAATALVLLLCAPATAQNRLALIIGNDAYQNVDPLQKAVSDARAVAATMQQLGFQTTIGENLSRREFLQLMVRTEAQVQPGDTVFFFYAGHGVEIDGANYLLPVDVPRVAAGQQNFLKDESISTDNLIQRLKARGARSQIVVLDACRENPFRDTTGRSIAGSRGLGASQPTDGVFILYSAGIGEVALDRLGDDDPNPNSIFTRALVPLLARDDISLVTLAKDVRAEVKALAATVGHQQSPAYYDEIDGHIFLARLGAPGGQTSPAQTSPARPAPPPQTMAQMPVAPAPIAPAPMPGRTSPAVAAPVPVPDLPARINGFIFLDSDRRRLSINEVLQLTPYEMRIARNEIFARKGRIFRSSDLQDHFGRMPWYQPRHAEVRLNAIEKANVTLIQAAER